MTVRQQSPLRCPITGEPLKDIRVIPLGPVTGELVWELHAGRSDEYGWFQAEVISKPPREIFPVNRPGGTARRMLIGGRPVYAFPTIWDSTNRRTPVDMYDPDYWQVDWSRLPARDGVEVEAG
ncbi:hypothetical protein BH23CHL2_BH23CHL2_14910 [soil metagenome]